MTTTPKNPIEGRTTSELVAGVVVGLVRGLVGAGRPGSARLGSALAQGGSGGKSRSGTYKPPDQAHYNTHPRLASYPAINRSAKTTIPPILIALILASTTLWAQTTPTPYGLEQRHPNHTLRIHSSGNATLPLTLRQVFDQFQFRYNDTSFMSPVTLTYPDDGTNRLFIAEKIGRIRTFENRDDVAEFSNFLQLAVKQFPAETGLLAMAFHPHYRTNGLFYVHYTHEEYGPLYSRIAEFRVSADDPNRADPTSERIILEVEQPHTSHNGGQILFGPDGYLYIGLGDGVNPGDPLGNSQNRATLLGAILRIDIDTADPERAYAIPPDNPFVGNSQGWREEIWAWGLRNPWRFTFDALENNMWGGDVGQDDWEEINLIEKGKNYGWNTMEAFHCFPPNTTQCNTSDLELPIFEYGRSQGHSVIGGYVYRGQDLPQLWGHYIYGDFVSQRVWALEYTPGEGVKNQLIATSPTPIAAFGQDQMGELYLLSFNGQIYRLENKPQSNISDSIPPTISASGLFSDIATQLVAPGLIPYSVNAELWSDGAYKTRFLALPDTAKILFSERAPWQFPPSTVLVKNFYLEMESGKPASRQIVETRFLVKRPEGEDWDGFSYMWNDAGTDATLLDGAHTKSFTIAAPEGNRQHLHYYPSRNDCRVCHTAAAGHVLGVRTAQLNRLHDYGHTLDQQLRSLNHIRLFEQDIGADFSHMPRLPSPFDPSADLEQRARAYLDANCAQCHRPGGSGRSDMDLRFATPLGQAHLVDALPTIGLDDRPLLKPGTPEHSLLYLRLTGQDTKRMPPLASFRIDQQGAALIHQWITSLGSTQVEASSQTVLTPLTLSPSYPNPFNSTTTINFILPTDDKVDLSIYNLKGQPIASLVEGHRQAGHYTIRWDGRDQQGHQLASGVYLYQLRSGQLIKTQKLLLLR